MLRNGRFGIAAALLLGACGGGGDTSAPPQPAPAPAPAPVPAPAPSPPPPTPSEDDLSNAATFANAAAAYSVGATGKGVTVALIDSGIDAASAEFAGRIASTSADLVSNRGIQSDPGGPDSQTNHGTWVAGILGAARNGHLTHGVAYDATLQVLRIDNVGSCAKSCTFSESQITNGINVATASGARVINISLGAAKATDVASPEFAAAVAAATAKGIVVVLAAGNESRTSVNALAAAAIPASVNNGAAIIAGAVNSNGTIASFTNTPGADALNITLNALGTSVNIFGLNGTFGSGDGTSFSAPAISGAAALLAQQFPNLTGQQIVNLLLTTATDEGATGADAIYGRGNLNIQAAFAPQGSITAAGTRIPVTLGTNAVGGGALGSGSQIGGASVGVVVLDGYKRAYKVDLGRTITPAREAGLAGALLSQSRSVALGTAARSLSFSLAPGAGDRPELGLAQKGLDAIGDGSGARAGMAHMSLWAGADISLGFGTRVDTMAEAATPGAPGFLIAPNAGLERVMPFSSARGVRFGQRLGSWSFAVAAGSSEAYATHALAPLQTSDWQVSAGRRLGPATLGLSVSGRGETGGLLGATFGPAFGIARANTTTLGLDGALALGNGWRLDASARHGWTAATTGAGLVTGVDGVRSFGWRLDIARASLLAPGDSFAFRLAQPMRVVDGAARLYLPTSYDYTTGVVGFSSRTAGLTPSGTERDVEAVYGRSFGWGSLAGHLFLRDQPGHLAEARDDTGAALTLEAAF